MSNEEFIQKLYTEAYDIYKQHNEDRDKIEQLLSKQHRIAVIFGTFNYQVGNGGFEQWLYNYSEQDKQELQQILKRGIDQDLKPLVKILELVEKAISIKRPDDELFDEDLTAFQSEIKIYEEKLNVLDGEYYEQDEEELFKAVADLIKRIDESVTPKPRNPVRVKPTVTLSSGVDGNAMSIIATVSRVLKTNGYTKQELDQFKTEALSGDYDNVIQTAMKWVDVV